MTIRGIAFAAAASLMLAAPVAAPAFAATRTPVEQCGAMRLEFDNVIKGQSAAPNSKEAQDLRREAEALCTSGKPKHGVEKMREAFRLIGTVPKR